MALSEAFRKNRSDDATSQDRTLFRCHQCVHCYRKRGVGYACASIEPKGLELRRPSLVAVKDCDKFQPIPSNSVGNDVGSIGYYKFSGPKYPSGPSHLGVRLKKINRIENALGDKSGVFLRVFGNELSDGHKVLYSSARPDDLHPGAFVSPGLPQVLSHFETFS